MTNYSITPRREYDREADWRERAECLKPDVNAEFFFPAGYDWETPQSARRAREAKNICHACPVANECLKVAMDRPHDPWAILGGLLPDERKNLRRSVTRAAAKRDAS